MCDSCARVESRITEHLRIGGKTVQCRDGSIARILGTRTLPRSGMPVVRLADVKTKREFVMSYEGFVTVRFSGVA